MQFATITLLVALVAQSGRQQCLALRELSRDEVVAAVC
jgi:hypothetical protein